MGVDHIVKISELVQHAYFWVVTVLGGGGVIAWRIFRARKVRYPSLAGYVTGKFGAGEDLLLRVAKSLTCAVVDDKPEDFPADFLRGMFKSVAFENRVSLNDATRLAAFDVIFLDVAGVVVEDLQRGGAILIKRIRDLRSDGLIISVSSKKYDVEVTDYFEMADVRIKKPVQAATVQQQVMAHLRKEVGPLALAERIDSRLLVDQRRGLRRQLINLLDSAATPTAATVPSEVNVAGLRQDFQRLHGLVRRLQIHER